MRNQCPTCGRCDQDWRSPTTRITDENGTKARLLGSDLLEAYRQWRYTLGGGLVATDADQIEWRQDPTGAWLPAAFLELTRVEGTRPLPASYLQGILERKERDHEIDRQVLLAKATHAGAYVVCYRENLSEFFCARVHPRLDGWRTMSLPQYTAWLRSLTPGRTFAEPREPGADVD